MRAPPPLVIFNSPDKYLDALDSQSRKQFGAEIEELIDKGLPPVVSIRALSVLFGYRSQFIGTMMARPHHYYRTFTIPKGKKKRQIQAPKVALKVIQKWFGHYLARAVSFPDQVIGFVPNRSTMHGASKHCGASWIYTTDIENFFQSTSTDSVTQALVNLGYHQHGAEIITKLSSLNGNLAQGSPASPVLSNLAFNNADVEISQLCQEISVNYTRYADDIAISGRNEVPVDLDNRIKEIVEKGEWKLSKEKTSLIKAPKRLKVYGLIVNGDKPRLTKGYRRRIRAIRHLMETEKLQPDKAEEAAGHIAYADSIDNFVNYNK